MSIPQAVIDTADERARQDRKWGEQNHPDGTGPDEWVLVGVRAQSVSHLERLGAHRLAAAATLATDAAAQAGTVTWSDILLEEVFEALAEDDPTTLRNELVQVAAVAQQWVEAIDRRARG